MRFTGISRSAVAWLLLLPAASPATAQLSSGEPNAVLFEESSAIIVTGQRLEARLPYDLDKFGTRIETISRIDIERGGYVDTGQILQNTVPGLYVAPKNGAFDYVNVSLLGSRTQDVLFLVDGVRISNRLYSGTTPLDTLPANMIERIEVLKGGQGLFYGTQSVAGVVNIVTRDFTSELSGQLSMGAHTNDGYYLSGVVGDALLGGLVTLYGSHDQADGFQPFSDEDYQPSATDRNRSYDVTVFGAKYARDLAPDLRLTVSAQYTEAELDFAVPNDKAQQFNGRNEEIVSVKLDWTPNERISLLVKGYLHDWDSTYTSLNNVLGADGQPTGDLTASFDGDEWEFFDRGINILGEYTLSDSVEILAGYDFQKYEGSDFVLLIDDQAESVHAPFAQIRWQPAFLNGARFAAGVRHNAPDDGEAKTVWNLSGEVDATRSTYIRGQVGTSFRLPSAFELYNIDPCCAAGNPNLQGEESFNLEGAFGARLGGFNAELIGFHRSVDNLIGRDFSLPGFPDGLIVNTDEKIEFTGFEFIVSGQLSDDMSITFDYTHTIAEPENSDEQIDEVPKDLVKFLLNWDPQGQRYGLGASLNYVGDVFDSVGGGIGRVEHGGNLIADLTGYVFLDRALRHRLGVRLENAFDETYASQLRTGRLDSNNAAYVAEALGTPRTLHVRYSLNF